MNFGMTYRQRSSVLSLTVVTLMLAFAGVLSFGGSANGADIVIDLPAGLACADFDLGIEITGPPAQVYKEFKDKDGNVIRILTAGKGWDFLFVNRSTNATFPLKGNGSVSQSYSFEADGSYTFAATGHNVVIFFPTDLPPGTGPSTMQYIGRIVYTVDQNGVCTLQQSSGKQIDICAGLSQ